MENYKNMIKTISIGGISLLLIAVVAFIIGVFVDLSFNLLIKISVIAIPTVITFCIFYTLGSLLKTLKSYDNVEHYDDSCEFCNSLRDRSKKVTLMERSKTSDDNLFDILFKDNDTDFIEDQISEFLLTGYKADDNFYLMVDYVNNIKLGDKELNIHKFSNGFQLNYCPTCGDKISNKLKRFEDNYSITIEDVD